jgi:HK97 family phage portal protein
MTTGTVPVNNATAMRHSAVWACLALRAGLMASFPVDTFRDGVDADGNKVAIEIPPAPILKAPGGEDWGWLDWGYATQVDMDRAGNAIGLITERNGIGLPARIDLQDISSCTVTVLGENSNKGKPGSLRYRIHGKEYGPQEVWHERQYRLAGLAVGLSPIAMGAWAIGEYLSMQDFALAWFGGAGVPKAKLKNTALNKVDNKEAGIIRDRWAAMIHNGDLFVHGKDWEYEMLQANVAGTEFIEGRRFGLSDISRFFQCPADLIDAAISAPGTLTYATISQRNLQFLIMQLGPAVRRREANLSKLIPAPRYVKLNTDALLALDPETRARVINAKIAARRMTPNEARRLENMAPLSVAQEDEFIRLFGDPSAKAPSNAPPKLLPGNLSAEELAILDRVMPIQAIATVGTPEREAS